MTLLNKLTFDFTNYNVKKLKDSVIILAAISILYSILFFSASFLGSKIWSALLLVCVVAYEFLTLSALDRLADIYIHKKVYRTAKSFVISFSIFALIFIMLNLFSDISSIRTESKLLPLIAAGFLLMSPVYFWDKLLGKYRSILKVSLIVGVFLAPNISFAQFNSTFTATEINESLQQANNTVVNAVTILGAATKFMEAFQGAVGSVLNLKENVIQLGLSNTQYVAIALLIATALMYFVFRFLKWLTKWLVLALFTWILLQIAGVL